MSDPSLPLQRAYYERLKAEIPEVAERVYDSIPASTAFPYIQIGDIQVISDGAGCIDSTEVYVTVHVWSRAQGQVENRRISGNARTALHEWLPDLPGFSIVEHEHRDTRTLDDPDGITSHGVMTFRALIDPA